MGAYKIMADAASPEVQKKLELERRVSKSLDSDEGRKNKAYKDHLGNWTIGAGHKIRAEEKNLMEATLTDTQIDELKKKDIKEITDQVKYMTKNSKTPFNFDDLPIAQQEALVNLTFNMGYGEVSTWNNTLKFLSEGNYKEASKEILRGRTSDTASKYSTQLPNRSKRVSELMASA
jgi:GH24 family phage-related lysozyme (muramidase)